MLDAAITTGLQRSRGAVTVRLGPRGLADLAQSGSGRAMLPRLTAGPPEIVLLNTAGGLASGDRLDYRIALEPGTRATATTQTAERAYRAKDAPAKVRLHMQVGENGWLDWLPQETILYDGARLSRETVVDLAPGAGCLLLEPLVLGRTAMGEEVRHLHLNDRRVVRRDGRVIHHDALALNDAALSRRHDAAMLGDARAMATLALIAPDAPGLLEAARAVLDEPGVTGAASAPAGRLILRLLAADGWPLRRQVNRLLAVLRPGSLSPGPFPLVWQV